MSEPPPEPGDAHGRRPRGREPIGQSTPDTRLSKYRMIHNAVLQACDALDGSDGVRSANLTKCKFDYALACKSGDGPRVLRSPSRIGSSLTSPLKHLTTGVVLFEGHLWPGAD